MVSHVPKTCKVVLADTIARGMLAEVRESLAKVQRRQPSLVAFLANSDAGAVKYAEWSQKACVEKYSPPFKRLNHR